VLERAAWIRSTDVEKEEGTVFPVWRVQGILERIRVPHKLGDQFDGGASVSNEKKASATLPGRVERIIKPHPKSGEAEKAQIEVEGADHLYKEIRVPNSLIDEEGHKVKLRQGAEVEVKIEADSLRTTAEPAESTS